MNDVVRRKAGLRVELSGAGERIPAATRDALEPRMRAGVLDLPELRAARGVLVCLSFGTEPQTRPLIEALEAAGKTVYLPRADRHDRQLHAHRWPCELETLRFGLAQPVSSAPELPAEQIDAEIHAIVVLGLAFDAAGVRLGHGSGYVDRFLTAHPMFAVGLTFEALLVPRLPRATHDVPMSVLVTEDRVVRPEADPRRALRTWLSDDHTEIDGLLRHALRDDGFDPAPFARFRERLLRHIGIEERILFPAAREHEPTHDAERLAALRVDHAALTTLLVPTPDRALALEIASLLGGHNEVEESEDGVYDACLAAITPADATRVLHAARGRAPVPTTGYFDGPGTVRTAQQALEKARGASTKSKKKVGP